MRRRRVLAKPTVFLSIDDLTDPAPYSSGSEEPGREGGSEPRTTEQRATKRVAFHQAIKQSDTYDAAVRKAFELSGSLKMFKLGEDVPSVRDNDVFVYIGEKSKRVGKAIRDSVDITVMSSLELRRSIKSNKLVTKDAR